MRLLRRFNLALVALLSVAAGVAKVLELEHEIRFFQDAGLDGGGVAFGLLQIAAGILLVTPVTRTWGAALAALMFLGSVAMLLVTGQVPFALFSLLPVLLATLVVVTTARDRQRARNEPGANAP